MEIVHSVRKLNTKKKTAVAVGYFDGMHLGHQELIHRMIEYAKKYNYSPAILTFDMHILRAEGKGKHDLFPREYTMHLAEKEGIDFYIDLPFEEIRNLKPDQFAKNILGEQFLCADAVFCGSDFRYGRDRAGTIENLKLSGKENNFSVYEVEAVTLDGEIISTTRIKEFMKEGNVKEANRMLGKPYSICGEVIHGNHLAQLMGFPTANILVPDSILPPKKGVYLTETIFHGHNYRSITNIGTRPTITDDVKSTAETHILDFNDDIYGEKILVKFYEFIRPEQKFNNVEELKRTVIQNINYAKECDDIIFQKRRES